MLRGWNKMFHRVVRSLCEENLYFAVFFDTFEGFRAPLHSKAQNVSQDLELTEACL